MRPWRQFVRQNEVAGATESTRWPGGGLHAERWRWGRGGDRSEWARKGKIEAGGREETKALCIVRRCSASRLTPEATSSSRALCTCVCKGTPGHGGSRTCGPSRPGNEAVSNRISPEQSCRHPDTAQGTQGVLGQRTRQDSNLGEQVSEPSPPPHPGQKLPNP